VSSLLRTLNRPAVAIIAVTAIAGGLRFWNLDHPSGHVFDEVYYAKDACHYLGGDEEACDQEDPVTATPKERTWVHPPLGKWTIALGEWAFGNDEFGWRFSSALLGTLSVAVVAGIALLLFDSALWAFLAGLLLATEHLHFVQSRISMLDIHLAFWVALGLLLLLLDRRWIDRRTRVAWAGSASEARNSPGPGAMAVDERPVADAVILGPAPPPGWVASPFWHPWRFGAGVAFGAACATKWSGAFALAGAIALAVMWERTRRTRARVDRAVLDTVVQESFGVLVALVFVPILVYLMSYAGFWVEQARELGWDLDLLGEFWRRHEGMFGFHKDLDVLEADGSPSHPYLSRPFTWLLLLRPVAYYFHGPGTEILGVGNPVIFWASLLALPYLALRWALARDWRPGFLLVAISAQYLPWIVFSRPQFLFYMTPIAPFLVLAVVYACHQVTRPWLIGERVWPVAGAALMMSLSVAAFAFFWPVLTAYPLSREAWDLRIWVNCGEALAPFGCGWV
jgi:dolichyl-phosphate-mannose-protein mannosyltransferase